MLAKKQTENFIANISLYWVFHFLFASLSMFSFLYAVLLDFYAIYVNFGLYELREERKNNNACFSNWIESKQKLQLSDIDRIFRFEFASKNLLQMTLLNTHIAFKKNATIVFESIDIHACVFMSTLKNLCEWKWLIKKKLIVAVRMVFFLFPFQSDNRMHAMPAERRLP